MGQIAYESTDLESMVETEVNVTEAAEAPISETPELAEGANEE